MKSTFSVIYYLKRQVVKKDGTVPVMGRITVDGSQTQFSCKLSVDPKLWDTKGGRVTGRSAAALETNRMLDKMRVRINRHYQEIMERDIVPQDVPQDDLDAKILALIKKDNKISTEKLGMALGVSYKTIRRHIKAMGNVRYVGRGFSGHWEVDNQSKTDI